MSASFRRVPPYADWRTALSSVQGIYLIADSSNGKQYVGKADGSEGILGRWRAYAGDGHGGNMALRELAGLDPSHRSHFVFSIRRVFGPEALKKDLNAAEAHCRDALLLRTPSVDRSDRPRALTHMARLSGLNYRTG